MILKWHNKWGKAYPAKATQTPMQSTAIVLAWKKKKTRSCSQTIYFLFISIHINWSYMDAFLQIMVWFISDKTDCAFLTSTVLYIRCSLLHPCYCKAVVSSSLLIVTHVSLYLKSFYITATDYKLVMWIWTFFQHITTTICYNHDYIIVF